MAKLILVIGGARSGKSRFAIKLADGLSGSVVYIATAQPFDKEMIERIKLHKKNRNKSWKTIEEPRDLEKIKKLLSKNDKVILFECLTLLISNLLSCGVKEKNILSRFKAFLKDLKTGTRQIIVVSNEVGWGIVPENNLARDFRDVQGRANQLVAELADEVYFIVAGIVNKIK